MEKPAPAHQSDWKEERRRRVENAMKRVEQSYVGELRYAHEESTYVRPDHIEYQEARKPPALVPLAYATGAPPPPQAPAADFGENRGYHDDKTVERIDRSLLIPSSKNKGVERTPEEELELDMRRQSLLERKIREANEFHRKQKLNAFKPYKEEPGERPRGPNQTSHLPASPSQPKVPVPPIRDDRNGVICPMPPSMQKQEDSFSKRRRKLKPYPAIGEGANTAGMEKPTTGKGGYAPQQKYDTSGPYAQKGLSQAVPDTTKEGRHGVSFDIDTKGFEKAPRSVERTRACGANPTAAASPSGPKPPLIPRQASYNIWNGDTAKRGLGFKSKLRKEMEEASLRSLEPKEDADAAKKSQRTYVSPEVAAKWKRKVFYDC